MDQQNQPHRQPKRLEVSPEDLEKVRHAREREQPVEVDAEWLAIAEFGKHYGWAAVRAVLNDEIDAPTMAVLLQAARKVDMLHLFDDAQAAFIGNASASSQTPSETFQSATNSLLKHAKADV